MLWVGEFPAEMSAFESGLQKEIPIGNSSLCKFPACQLCFYLMHASVRWEMEKEILLRFLFLHWFTNQIDFFFY